MGDIIWKYTWEEEPALPTCCDWCGHQFHRGDQSYGPGTLYSSAGRRLYAPWKRACPREECLVALRVYVQWGWVDTD